MGIVKQHIVDNERNQITFLDSRWYLCEQDNNFYPSSSTILDAYPKSFAFYEWLKRVGDSADEIRDVAGDKGSTVHKLTEMYDLGEEVTLFNIEGNIDFRQVEWAMFEKYVQFIERFKPEILYTEMSMVSPILKYGGTLDRVIRLNGKTYLVDIKTSNLLHNHFWLQLASYVKLFNEKFPDINIDGVAILYLNAKTRTEGKKGDIQGIGWQLVFPPEPLDHYWGLFKATQALWLEENGSSKPRNLTYKTTHKKEKAKLIEA